MLAPWMGDIDPHWTACLRTVSSMHVLRGHPYAFSSHNCSSTARWRGRRADGENQFSSGVNSGPLIGPVLQLAERRLSSNTQSTVSSLTKTLPREGLSKKSNVGNRLCLLRHQSLRVSDRLSPRNLLGLVEPANLKNYFTGPVMEQETVAAGLLSKSKSAARHGPQNLPESRWRDRSFQRAAIPRRPP
jgi:hypothetical protein